MSPEPHNKAKQKARREKWIAVRTQCGTLRGRDAIFLDRVRIDRDRIKLEGEFNGLLCSIRKKHRSIAYSCTFVGVLAVRIYELESCPPSVWRLRGDWMAGDGSSFDEVKNSRWIRTLGKYNLTPKHRHYWFQTYDYVYEIVCVTYELTLGKARRWPS